MAPAAQAASPADPSDELWAARAARDAAARQGRPCPSGARFDDVASRAQVAARDGTRSTRGRSATRASASSEARGRDSGTLLGVPSYRDRAR